MSVERRDLPLTGAVAVYEPLAVTPRSSTISESGLVITREAETQARTFVQRRALVDMVEAVVVDAQLRDL